MRDHITSGTQSVAVERCADNFSIGECNRCGTVPWLHQRCVVLVERFFLRLNVRIAGPGFGDQHGHHVRDGASAHSKQFDCVIKVGRVAASRLDNWEQFFDIAVKCRRFEDRLASVHPRHIALQCVDFAVVRNVAVGMGQLPAGKSIRRKTLVNQA